MNIRMVLKCDLGEYKSEEMDVTEEQFNSLVEMSKSFYMNGGFEMHLDNGFLVVPPEIIKKSILMIEIV